MTILNKKCERSLSTFSVLNTRLCSLQLVSGSFCILCDFIPCFLFVPGTSIPCFLALARSSSSVSPYMVCVHTGSPASLQFRLNVTCYFGLGRVVFIYFRFFLAILICMARQRWYNHKNAHTCIWNLVKVSGIGILIIRT